MSKSTCIDIHFLTDASIELSPSRDAILIQLSKPHRVSFVTPLKACTSPEPVSHKIVKVTRFNVAFCTRCKCPVTLWGQKLNREIPKYFGGPWSPAEEMQIVSGPSQPIVGYLIQRKISLIEKVDDNNRRVCPAPKICPRRVCQMISFNSIG